MMMSNRKYVHLNVDRTKKALGILSLQYVRFLPGLDRYLWHEGNGSLGIYILRRNIVNSTSSTFFLAKSFSFASRNTFILIFLDFEDGEENRFSALQTLH
jgi:hypothetical protein